MQSSDYKPIDTIKDVIDRFDALFSYYDRQRLNKMQTEIDETLRKLTNTMDVNFFKCQWEGFVTMDTFVIIEFEQFTVIQQVFILFDKQRKIIIYAGDKNTVLNDKQSSDCRHGQASACKQFLHERGSLWESLNKSQEKYEGGVIDILKTLLNFSMK